jgi:hypothetical protein
MTAFIHITGSALISLVASFIVIEVFQAFRRADTDDDFDFESAISSLPGYSDLDTTHEQPSACAGEVC